MDREPAIDDVVAAYRWILGREPESLDIIKRWLVTARHRADLRRLFILSSEFQKKYQALRKEEHDLEFEIKPLSPDVSRFVFIHIPKTGGTMLHVLLEEAIGIENVSRERHNTLWRSTGAELSKARLFSGHYDRRCLSVVPGPSPRVVTILREPRQRLLSVYKYLRAHTEAVVQKQNLELASAARRLTYGKFLEAALHINPASVDNTYLRAFGAYLPVARWEQRAEPMAIKPLSELGDDTISDTMVRAVKFLNSFAAIGILENFEQSLRTIFLSLGLAAPVNYVARQRLDDLVTDNPAFEPIDNFDITPEDREIEYELTRFDAMLYQNAKRLLVG